MGKSLLEMQNESMNFRTSKRSQKNRDFAQKRDAILENKGYDRMLTEDAKFEMRKNIVSESAKFAPSHSARHRRGKMLREAYKYQQIATNQLFTEALVDMCFNSLILDADFKNEHVDNIKGYFKTQIEKLSENGEINIDESAQCIKDLYKVCEETAIAAKDDILKASKDDVAKQGKELLQGSAEPETEGGETISEASLDNDSVVNSSKGYVNIPDYVKGDYRLYVDDVLKDVYSVIKDKVVDVIKSEKDAEEVERDLREQIISNVNTSVTDEETSEYETQTELDLKGGSIGDVEMANNSTTKTPIEIGNGPQKKISESFNISHHAKRTGRTPSLFQSIIINTGKNYIAEQAKLVQENESIVADVDFDMDMVFAESIIVYTLIESLNTTKLYSMDPTKARTKVIDFIMK